MSNEMSSKRIAKNSLFLNIRLILGLVISLFTSRVILQVLGAEDLGVYNVVGGVVTMAGFLNDALAVATSRFLTYNIGKEDHDILKKTFASSLNLHLIVALIVFIFSETIGLWFLTEKLVIPEDRINAAFWVYQFSVFNMMISFTQVPYNSAIIAHERMSVYAYVGLYESISKLIILYLLLLSTADKLIIYSLLLMLNSVGIQLFYRWYCIKNFKECRFAIVFDKEIYKPLLSYSSWNLLGGFAYVIQNQGISILLNIFFGPIVNAAQAITIQIQSVTMRFVQTVFTAVRPQTIINYSKGNIAEMYNLTFKSAKYSIFFFLALILPICFNLKFILRIWLGSNVPEETLMFTQLVLITCCVDLYHEAMLLPYSAIGKMRDGNLLGGLIMVSALPIGYLFLKLGFPAYSVFVVIFFTIVIRGVIISILVHKYASFDWRVFVVNVIKPTIMVSLLAIVFPILINVNLPDNWFRCIVSILVSEISLFLIVYFLGLDHKEKEIIFTYLKVRFPFLK